LKLAAVAKIRLPVLKVASWQNASRAYQPIGEVPTCISAVYASDKWIVECFQLTHLKHLFIVLISSLPTSAIIAFLNFGFAFFRMCRV